MALLVWDDRRFPLVEAKDMLVAEGRWVEKNAGKSIDELGTTDGMIGRIAVTLRRASIMMRWQDFDEYTYGQLEDLIELEPGDTQDAQGEDPTTTGAEAGTSSASRPRTRRTSSTSSTPGTSTPETSSD